MRTPQTSSRRRSRTITLGLVTALVVASGLVIPGRASDRTQPPAPPAGAGIVPAHAQPTAQAGSGRLRLLAGAFDPTTDTLPVPAAIRRIDEAALPPSVAQPFLVQAKGGDIAGLRRAIDTSGATFESALPDDGALVRATPAQRSAIAASPAVRWTGLLQPGWKVPVAVLGLPGLLDLDGPQTYKVFGFRSVVDDAARAASTDALRAVPGVKVVAIAPDTQVWELDATSAAVPAIAALPGVQWIEAKGRIRLHNANSRWVTDTAERDHFNATLPGRLTGAGQVAAVADTSPNYTTSDNGTAHAAFRDCPTPGAPCKIADYTQQAAGGDDPTNVVDNRAADGQPRHSKVVAFFDIGGAGPNPPDDASHGTHVTGSVLGDVGRDGTWSGNDGLAPAAKLVSQGIGTPDGGLSGTTDDYDLWRQAYRPANPAGVPTTYDAADAAKYDHTRDARTHNNSYGAIFPVLSVGAAEAADRFVWDHEDMVIVSSAGNEGPGSAQISAPSIGRNVVTSAASAGGRQPAASIDSLAIFSSHGPDGAGAFGIDLATPGQIVVSTKGGTDHDEHVLQGTSMSGPVLTGIATLVRQYFFDGYGPAANGAAASALGFADGVAGATGSGTNPSAALVRAALVNGASRMRGRYTGDDGQVADLDGQYPSNGQGFGLVNLRDSLFFDDAQGRSRHSAFFVDVWRKDTHAFALTAPGPLPVREYKVHVAPGAPLQVTLAFTDAPTGLPAGTPTPVNDLDLEVVDPDGAIRVGNNFNTRGSPAAAEHEVPTGSATADSRNPVEKVRVAAPKAGEWTIRVRGSKVLDGPQGFAVAATGLLSSTPGGFTPGGPDLVDQPGVPVITGVSVTPLTGDTARVTFSTTEPTTAAVVADGVTHVDSYNLGPDGYPGIPGDPVETSAQYANRAVVATNHEVVVTGLQPGSTTDLRVDVTDLGGTTASRGARAVTNAAVIGSLPGDTGQLIAAATDDVPPDVAAGSGFGTATQMYAGQSGGNGYLGAFKFRVPPSVDPSRIKGAAVELTSMHDFINHYRDDTRVHVDLLPADLEPSFSEQNYGTIHGAPSQARLNGDAGDKSGAYRTYSFAFGCEQLGALQATLGAVADGSRQAAFRYDADTTAAESLFSMETGFNRRSAGIEYRPRLVLFLDDGRGGAIDPLLCDPSLPAPSISDVGVTPVSSGVTSVSWRTNVPSDSTVLFRARGSAGAWTQVANPARATVHAVSVAVPDASAGYEFAVRSATCGGATTTDDRSGTGYTFAPQRPTAPAAVPTVTNWFNGAPPAATFSPSPPSDASTETQTALVIGDDTTPGASDVAAWSGPQSGEIRRIDFDWWWSTDNPLQVALGPEVAVSVFTSATPTGPWTRIGGGSVPIAVDVGTPVRSQGGFPLSGTSQGHLLFQVSGRYVDTSQTQTVHYGSTATPSSFAISTAAPLAGPGVPTAIPFPPVPAGSSGLDAGSVATRTDPNAGDLRAGTARCASLFASAAAGGIGSRLPGYRMVAGDGGIFTFGARTFHGSTGDLKLRAPIVGGATDVSDDDGYWIVASDGGVFTFGTEFHGSLGDRRLPSPAVEIEPTPTGKGYWVVLANGKVFTFGDANHFGDMEGRPLNKPMIGMSVTPSGRGYWLVAEDGGIFNFGDAGFFGSTGDKRLNAPIIDLAPSTDNAGYYLLGKDGGVFTFGSADFKGSTGSLKLNAPVVAMLVSHDGSGYWLGASDGGVFTFGAVPFLGSMGDVRLNSPVLDLIH